MAARVMGRRSLCLAGLGAGLLSPLSAVAQAAAYPTRAVTLVSSFAPGNVGDALVVAIAEELGAALRQTVHVSYVPGGGGSAAAAKVLNGPADGYAFYFGAESPFAVGPAVSAQLPYPVASAKVVMVLGASGMVMAAHPSLGVKTLKELAVKGKKTLLRYATAGNGSLGHIIPLLWGAEAGLKQEYAPYKSYRAAMDVLQSGQADWGVFPVSVAAAAIRAGKLTPLAVTSQQRVLSIPAVPTVAEAGYPSHKHEMLIVAAVPADTPPSVVSILSQALKEMAGKPHITRQLGELDFRLDLSMGPAAQRRLDEMRAYYMRKMQTHRIALE